MKVQKRATIRDVAAATGLALSTVSNALAGKVYVSDETRALVSETAERLGYRASSVARALRMQRSFAIGVLIADVANPSSADFVRGVEDVAIAEHCSLFLCNTDGDEERQLWHMRTLVDRQVDGMVLISQHCSSLGTRELLNGSTPFVLVQRRSSAFRDDYVGSSNTDGIGDAVQHLANLGHTRIGFVRGPMDSSSAQERLDTFRRQVKALGLSAEPTLVFNGDYTIGTGYSAADYFMGLGAPPTAIMGSSDMNSLGIIERAKSLGFSIPHDLSVIGLDDISFAGLSQINLTTVRLPKREMGTAAGELLMRRARGETTEPQTIIFPTELIIRGTTAAASSGRRATAKKRSAVRA